MILFGLGLLLLGGWLTYLRREPPQSSYFLAFTSSRSYGLDIYRMNADGQQEFPLTDAFGTDLSPNWSPDGRWIAFTTTRDGDREIYLVSSSGSRYRRITSNNGDDFSPRWSPDGKWILFLSRRDGIQEIYRVHVESGKTYRLTDGNGDKLDPQWSPDGKWVLFVNYRNDSQNLYRMRADGTDLSALTRGAGFKAQAAWSPDGQWIVFSSRIGSDEDLGYRNGQQKLYLMRADGSDRRLLVDTRGQDRNPIWSPDGKAVVFESGFIQKACPDDGDCEWATEVFRYDLATGTMTSLVRMSGYLPQSSYIWSPDGQWIAFVRYRFETASSEIFRMKPDGSMVEPITDSSGEDWEPVWSPVIDLAWKNGLMGIAGLSLILTGSWLFYKRADPLPAPARVFNAQPLRRARKQRDF